MQISLKRFILFASFFISLGALAAVYSFQLEQKPVVPNSVQLVLSPGAGEAYVEEMNAAKREIDLMLYQFSYKPLRQALAEAVKRGVKVRLVLEPRIDSNLDVAKELDAAGVEVRWASRDYANTHSKVAAVDGKRIFVGSTNWSQHAMVQNREVSVLIESEELVAEFMQVFEQDWQKAKPFVR